MKSKIMFGLVIVSALAFCLIIAKPVSAASDEEAVLQVAADWASAFNSSDYDAWASLWWKSPETSSFGPPKQMAFLTEGYDAIVSQLNNEFGYPEGTFISTISHSRVTMVGKDAAVLTQYQTFTLNPPAVKEQVVEQHRMTFVLKKTGGKWLIVHGHGSAFPTE